MVDRVLGLLESKTLALFLESKTLALFLESKALALFLESKALALVRKIRNPIMPIFRGKHGEVQQAHDDDELSTRKISRGNSEASSYPTQERDETNAPVVNTDEPKTRVLYRGASDNSMPTTEDAMSDPVVGWLVVVEGPGKGHALQLGYGMNSIGRDQNERICLNFGDEEISRTQHAIVTYDPRGRKFYVQHGGGQNLTYLGEQPLLVPAELHGNEDISLGQTTLRFVALCGEKFDWQNN